jgi:hypothetical protein
MEKADTRRVANGINSMIDLANDVVLTPEEAGLMFGVSKWAMYKRAKNGQAPSHNLGKKIYFLKSELMMQIKEL